MYRSHTCGELTAALVGQTVTLAGWVANRRDHGGVAFIDLRDRYGFTQVTVSPESKEAMDAVRDVRDEWVLQVTGTVNKRPEGQQNKNLPTGEIEISVTKIEVLSKSKVPPFPITDHGDLGEEVRYKHRYLDLRRRKVLQNVMTRAKMNKFTRDWFSGRSFLEVQTPIFTVSSPEGARDFLIPSRLHKGMFYALPQAPQQYKQLLMVGGVDKYFQIAPCFRDEDPRADRHSCEFYQIDVEMSFVHQEDIFAVAEAYVRDVVPSIAPNKRFHESCKNSVPRFTHKEALSLYGSDKPDLRFGCKFVDLTETFKESGFSVFKAAAATGTVRAFKLEGQTLTRKQIDELTEVAKSKGAGGLAYITYEAEGPKSPILKFLSDAEKAAITEKLGAKAGDMVFFGAGEFEVAVKSLGAVRLALRDKLNLASQDELAFCWITDFPMYAPSDIEEGKIDFEHNPFSMPHGGVTAFDGNPDPLSIYGMQYDMSCNGYEILSGSIRNHSTEALVKAFQVTGRGEAEVMEKFGAMYNAFQYGVPPHGGFAFGFDRLMMILVDEPNIREIYAFPKSGKAQDAMMNAPAVVEEKQLRELHIKIRD